MKNHIGTVVGLIGILLSVYFYSLSKQERVPVFEVSKVPTLIADTGEVNESKIRVLDSGGKVIEGEVWSLEFIFYNVGDLPLKKSEVLQDLVVELTKMESRILDYRINSQSRIEIVNGELSLTDSGVFLSYNILEEEDFIRGQVIFNGDRETSLELGGTLEGVKEIYSAEPLDITLFGFNLFKVIIGFTVGFVVLAILLLVISKSIVFLINLFPEKIISGEVKRKWSSKIDILEKEDEKWGRDHYLGLLFILVIIFSIAFYKTHPSRLKSAYQVVENYKLEFNDKIDNK
ncbi:hypothetical protein QFX18_11390 [Saccharophagus degradans]|uniref:hypothetical protein n=1 Tax=Saccharophagus degradans TaxID=86304 RepID=UPI002477E763|nr:hypothetical protein [Saccharophagus degradans]WGO96649.1 hypothetical protein QFX18_11390 [Saccharophagus degradans]